MAEKSSQSIYFHLFFFFFLKNILISSYTSILKKKKKNSLSFQLEWTRNPELGLCFTITKLKVEKHHGQEYKRT